MRVLVVDDNRDCADSEAWLIQACGHDVRVAYDGHSALELTREYRPDVMLIDIGMPDMDGNALAAKVRELPYGGRATLLAVSGWADEGSRRIALEAGFDGYYSKPADPKELLERLFCCPSTRLTPLRLRRR
ncbi:MAG: response regulator [Gemmataceae bacterium]